MPFACLQRKGRAWGDPAAACAAGAQHSKKRQRSSSRGGSTPSALLILREPSLLSLQLFCVEGSNGFALHRLWRVCKMQQESLDN